MRVPVIVFVAVLCELTGVGAACALGSVRNAVDNLIAREAAVVRTLLGSNSRKFLDEGVSPKYADSTTSGPAEERLKKGSSTSLSEAHGVYHATTFGKFKSALFASATLTVLTELGDRTFFISGLLALKYPKFIVFSASLAALVSQTVFSTLVGHICHLLPTSGGKFSSVPLDDYAAAILLVGFGFHTLRAACEPEESTNQEPDEARDMKPHYVELGDADQLTNSTHSSSSHISTPTHTESDREVAQPSDHVAKRRQSVNAEFAEAARDVEEFANAAEGAGFSTIWRKIYCIIFVAELGDKSMFSTVALAAAQNPFGVFLGSSGAHGVVTAIAVVAGAMLQGRISERTGNIAGAALFFLFGALALGEGIARQTHGAAVAAAAAAASGAKALIQA